MLLSKTFFQLADFYLPIKNLVNNILIDFFSVFGGFVN